MKHWASFFSVACIILVGALPALSQQPPNPAPELQKLNRWVGKWSYEGEIKPGPMGPGGEFTSKDTCEWFEGGFAIVCRSEAHGPTGPSKGMGILSYDPGEKLYTYYGVESMAPPGGGKGNVEGDTWTYHGEAKMEGQTMKFRYIIIVTSPTSHDVKAEYSVDGGPWNTMMEGKGTKE